MLKNSIVSYWIEATFAFVIEDRDLHSDSFHDLQKEKAKCVTL